MPIAVQFLLLFLIAFAVVGGFALFGYFVVFKLYQKKKDLEDLHKNTFRLKYCLSCGSDNLSKEGKCRKCGEQY